MPATKLTDRTIKTMKPPATGRKEIFDVTLPGFGIRVTANGRKSWIVFYRVQAGAEKGKQRRYTLEPPYPALGLADARKQAGAILVRVAEGEDPAREKQAAKSEQPVVNRNTIEAIRDDYLATKEHLRTHAEIKRALTATLEPWNGRLADSITDEEAQRRFDDIATNSGGYAANRYFAYARPMFKWARKKKRIAHNPMDAVDLEFQEQRRDRYFTDAETKTIWTIAPGLHEPYASYIKLLILTGMRPNALAKLEWSDIEGGQEEAEAILVPGERMKSGRPFHLPLPPLARRIIRRLPVQCDRDGQAYSHLFTSTHLSHAGKPIDPKALSGRVRELTGIEDWYPYAHRHSFGTGLARLGVPKHIRIQLMSHAARGDVTDGYDHFDYRPEKLEAMTIWSDHIAQLVQPDGAIVLR